MTTTPVMPSSSNVFVKSHDATNKMVIDYARNVKKFALNSYCQIVPVKAIAGLYLRMTIEEAGRILDASLNNFSWPDGAEAPEGNEALESFAFEQYRCRRLAYAFTLGDMVLDQASWNILAQHGSIKARQAMTARTQSAITTMTTTGNYAASHVLDVTAISGNSGNWAQSTSARQDIKRSLHTAAEVILDDTLTAIDMEDLQVVISSALAAELARTQEIVDYIKGSPDALAQVKGELPGTNTMYGLPDRLYGFKIVVEATRKVTNKKMGTRAASQILAKGTPFMCSRPGGLIGVADAPNFSTCVIFEQEAMTVETLRDARNRRTLGRIVDCFATELVAPASGVVFTNAA